MSFSPSHVQMATGRCFPFAIATSIPMNAEVTGSSSQIPKLETTCLGRFGQRLMDRKGNRSRLIRLGGFQKGGA